MSAQLNSSPLHPHNEMLDIPDSPKVIIDKIEDNGHMTIKTLSRLRHTVQAAERVNATSMIQSKVISATVREMQE